MRPRKWTKEQLVYYADSVRSIRQILLLLRLKESGGNYKQIKKYLLFYKIKTTNIKGRHWSKGIRKLFSPRISLTEILKKDSNFQSYKLKKRLYREGLKIPVCEVCGWSKRSVDGRVPVELDHINGNNKDNRISNLRILCPNCHSLQLTHRGRNSR